MSQHSIVPSTPARSLRAVAAIVASIALAVGLLAGALGAARAGAEDGSEEEEGTLVVSPESASPSVTDGNRLYDLDQARYGVYAEEGCKESSLLAVLSGGAEEGVSVPAGALYVKQLVAPEGYARDEGVHEVSVSADATEVLVVTEEPLCARPEALVALLDAETGTAAAKGGASLEGALYEVSYYDAEGDEGDGEPTRSWTFSTDSSGRALLSEECLVSGDALYEDEGGEAVLPLGSYVMEELSPSEGYLPDEGAHDFSVEAGEGASANPVELADPVVEVEAQVMRGEFSFSKVDDEGAVLAGVPFLVSYANGEEEALLERHVVVTDEDGAFSSAEASGASNANDAALSQDGDGEWALDEEALSWEAGVWFSLDRAGETAMEEEGLCSLPYGAYLLEELPCEANAGARELVQVAFEVEEDGALVELGEVANELPRIDTSAADGEDGDGRVEPSEDARVVDTVSYRNLTPGAEYALEGRLVRKSTGEALEDADGGAVEGEATFTPASSSGTVEVSFSFDATELAGESLVVFETLSEGGGEVASHEDLEDEEQTVEVLPRISTSARDAADGDGYIDGEAASIVDTVSYEGLEPGASYKLDARAVDAETGNVARNSDGTAISGGIEFEPEERSGEAEVELSFDTGALDGHDLVVFEVLRDEDDRELASHEDLEDEEQTVRTAGMDTVAANADDGTKFFYTASEEAAVEDTVSWSNLEAGETYELSATLVDAEDGEALEEGGETVSTTTSFTAQAASGEVEVELSFSPAEHGAEEVVVYERLSQDGVVVAVHEDLDDEDQTLTGLTPDEEEVTIEQASEGGGDGGSEGGGTVGTGERLAGFLTLLASLVLAASTAVWALAHRKRALGAAAGQHSVSSAAASGTVSGRTCPRGGRHDAGTRG